MFNFIFVSFIEKCKTEIFCNGLEHFAIIWVTWCEMFHDFAALAWIVLEDHNSTDMTQIAFKLKKMCT